jgi:hypothetical protein
MLYLQSTVYQVLFLRTSRLTLERDAASYLFRSWGPNFPESILGSETSDSSYAKELEKEGRHSFQQFEDCISENTESGCDSFGSTSSTYENGHVPATFRLL